MKKKIVISIVFIVSLAIVLRMFFHFQIDVKNIVPYNFCVTQNKIEFDISLRQGFYGVVDYSYEIESDRLYISFYGSYFIRKKPNTYVDHVSIFLNEKIKTIVFKSNHNEITKWQE